MLREGVGSESRIREELWLWWGVILNATLTMSAPAVGTSTSLHVSADLSHTYSEAKGGISNEGKTSKIHLR